MTNTKEVTMALALQWVGVSRLPKTLKEGELYSEGVAWVTKSDGKDYFVVMGTDILGNNVVKKDFEDTYAIIKINSIYPTIKFTADIDGKPLDKLKKQDKVGFVYRMRKWRGQPTTEEADIMSVAELDDLITRYQRWAAMIDDRISRNV